MTLFFILFLGAMAIGLTVYPLMRPSPEEDLLAAAGGAELAALRHKKEVIYGNIKDLEFEYRMGKLGDGDYRSLRNELKLEAAQVLSGIERLKNAGAAADPLEEEVLAWRREHLAPGSAAPKAAAGSPEAARHVCPGCGSEYAAGSKFCAECGQDLRAMAQSPAAVSE